jgi:UDP-glucose 4-epimerase
MAKKWLITGGCGFIGTNLVKKLVEKGGHFIRVLDNLSVGTRQDLFRVCDFEEKGPASESFAFSSLITDPSNPFPTIVQLIVEDIRNANIARKAAEGVDTIVHLAANAGVIQSIENPKQDMEVNVFGTLNMLEAARQNDVKRFIFASSGAPIGDCKPPIHEELAPHPASPYGASKLAGEGYCSAYYRTYGIETVVLRFSNVYGPMSAKKISVIATFLKKALKGEVLEIFGNGEQTRDFIYIDDLVNAIIISSKKNKISGEIFQIATNSETSINYLLDIVVKILNTKGCNNIKVKYSPLRLGEVKQNYSDTSKAKDYLKWRPRIDLENGIEKTIKWFLKNNMKNIEGSIFEEKR